MPETFGILYNICHGGFSFSDEFLKEYCERLNMPYDEYEYLDHKELRDDKVAISIFEEKGSKWCSGPYAELALREYPVRFIKYYKIEEYDGLEWISIDDGKFYKELVLQYVKTAKDPDPYLVEAVHDFLTTRPS